MIASMKTHIGIILSCAMCIAPSVKAQPYGQVPTVRYEGRPVEEIVKDGVPVRNYDGDGRVVIDPRDSRVREKPSPPVYNPGIILLQRPWRYGLPYQGERYVWGKTG
tara:strand:+ start:216 stop:536 length:321 start_codon:yes stop_codon:yes gene_type:complete